MKKIVNLYEMLVGKIRCLESLLLLVSRISVGMVFLESGWGKLHHIDKVIGFFTSLGIPAPEFQAYFVSATELACGAMLLVGLLTRLATLPLSITMVVALITAKKEDIHSLSDLFGTSEYLYIVIMGLLIVYGAGKISLDSLLSPIRKNSKK